MVVESFPERPLIMDDVKAIAQQNEIKAVYGMLIGDVTDETHGFDVNIGLNVDGGLTHDFFFDLVLDTGDDVTVAAYPRPELPSTAEAGPVDDPMEVLQQDDHSWELIYQDSKAETSIGDVVAAFEQFRDFSDQEATWVDGLAQVGVFDFIDQ